MNVLETYTDDLNVYLSLDQIIKYLEGFTDKTDGFRPWMMPGSFITNEKYDPECFSEELDNTEKDMLLDETIDIIKHVGHARQPFNTERWKENHAMGCQIKMEFPLLMMASCEKKVQSRINGQIVSSESYRCFASPENIEKITNWFNVLAANNQHVYSFWLA